MKHSQSKGLPPDDAKTSSKAEFDQHQEDAAVLEEIQAERLREHADAITKKAIPAFRLTATQQAIHDQILLDVADPSVHTVGLFGYAGVGKTVTTGALVQSLQAEYGSGVTLCATTHKAARQVEKAMSSLGVPDPDCITIHRLLGVRKIRDNKSGEEYFAADPKNPPVLDHTIRVVVIDETSMLPQQLYHLLMDACGIMQTILFVGDDRQLPPVSDGKLCPAFQEARS